ncbi:MAG: histidine phosphatase family protein [Verrucomicrobia bacterium]|nr:histidine phosphatase family protein [Verrucomicrobiota bacterium]
MSLLILMRHGESEWNKKNLFTGWVDVPLSEQGIKEAIEGGKKIAHLPIHVAFTSTLIRAQMTLVLALLSRGKVPVIEHPGAGLLEEWGHGANQEATIPVYEASELNERYYGDLQGLNKDEARAHYGKEQVEIWRRSFDEPPPRGESLQMTAARTLPYFQQQIVPHLSQNKNVFIAAHGNSLRAIVMQLECLKPDEVVKLEIATGVPLSYEYKEGVFSKR